MNRALSDDTATSSTEYPCASYFWIGVVVVIFSPDDDGIALESWTVRSDDPVKRYVPG